MENLETENVEQEQEQEITEPEKPQKEKRKKKENTDIYVEVKATEHFFWPLLKFRINAGEVLKVNQAKIDELKEKCGNFNLAIEQGKIIIGEK
jgi:hypothetical protein